MREVALSPKCFPFFLDRTGPSLHVEPASHSISFLATFEQTRILTDEEKGDTDGIEK